MGSPTPPWRVFDSGQLDALVQQVSAAAVRGERACPACGKTAVRSYRYPSERSTGPTVISYVWCANCHRYHGSTGPRRAGTDPKDPLTAEDHRSLDRDLPALLEHLDRLWDTGELPPR